MLTFDNAIVIYWAMVPLNPDLIENDKIGPVFQIGNGASLLQIIILMLVIIEKSHHCSLPTPTLQGDAWGRAHSHDTPVATTKHSLTVFV